MRLPRTRAYPKRITSSAGAGRRGEKSVGSLPKGDGGWEIETESEADEGRRASETCREACGDDAVPGGRRRTSK